MKLIYVILILLIIILIILIRAKLHKYKLYRDWIIAVDLSTETPICRMCFIKKIKPNGIVIASIPSLNNKICELIWVESKNNFYFSDQVDLIKDLL